MATFDCYVDTKPMANTVDSINDHIISTSCAVDEMKNAVVLAEQIAAQHICNNVDRGFFSLIRSQIAVKQAKHFTDMNAKLFLLTEHAKSLVEKQDRMESDVNRIRKDYYRIFHSLDKDLENRVFTLDVEAVKLVKVRNDLFSMKNNNEIASVKLMESEINAVNQFALMARVKNKTNKAISMLGNNALQNVNYRCQLNELLKNDLIEEEITEYIPVVYAIEKSMVMDSNVVKVFSPDYLEENTQNSINSKIISEIDELSKEEITDFSKIQNEYQNLVVNSDIDKRTADKMIEMFRIGEER